jgi:hypothetical protein
MIDATEVKQLTGNGIAICVEGDSYEDDAAYYRQWFESQARRVRFIPADGTREVKRAVAAYRSVLTDVPVYGILDRDFTPADRLDAEFETEGILRTSRFTLENYLLDPECWAQLFRSMYVISPTGAPDGWGDPDIVRQRIDAAITSIVCKNTSAYNFIVWRVSEQYPDQQPITLRYIVNIAGASNHSRLVQNLNEFKHTSGINDDLEGMFTQQLQMLDNMTPVQLHDVVSGKHVLQKLLLEFPFRYRGISIDELKERYIDKCVAVPTDIVQLVERIEKHAAIYPYP